MNAGVDKPGAAPIWWFEVLLVAEAVILVMLVDRFHGLVAGPWPALGCAGLMLALLLLRHDPDWRAVRAAATPVQGDLLRFALLLGAPLMAGLSGAGLIAWSRRELGWSGLELLAPIALTVLFVVTAPLVHLLAHRPRWRRPVAWAWSLRWLSWPLMLFAAWQWQAMLQRQLAANSDDPLVAFVVAMFFAACFYLPCRAVLHDGRRLALSLPVLVLIALALSGIGLLGM